MHTPIQLFKNEKGALTLKIREDLSFENVRVVKLFPLDERAGYVSVLNAKKQEVFLIKDPALLDASSHRVLLEELERRYFVSQIKRIQSLHCQADLAHWQVETDKGVKDFVTTFSGNNILFPAKNKIFIFDSYGHRFLIANIEQLEAASRNLLQAVI